MIVSGQCDIIDAQCFNLGDIRRSPLAWRPPLISSVADSWDVDVGLTSALSLSLRRCSFCENAMSILP